MKSFLSTVVFDELLLVDIARFHGVNFMPATTSVDQVLSSVSPSRSRAEMSSLTFNNVLVCVRVLVHSKYACELLWLFCKYVPDLRVRNNFTSSNTGGAYDLCLTAFTWNRLYNHAEELIGNSESVFPRWCSKSASCPVSVVWSVLQLHWTRVNPLMNSEKWSVPVVSNDLVFLTTVIRTRLTDSPSL